MELLRIFILHFVPAALPGLFMALLAYILFYKPPPRPMTPQEIKEALPLITRKAFVLDLYKQATKQ